LRVDPAKPIPQWIASFARAAQELEDVRVYVVAADPSDETARSCRAAGAGLISVTNEQACTLVVDPSEFEADGLRDAILIKARSIRKRLTTKYELTRNALEANYTTADQITRRSGRTADRGVFLEGIEEAYERLRDWEQEIAGRLDAVVVSLDQDELRSIEQLLQAGPPGIEL
jgi:hypothetical protein